MTEEKATEIEVRATSDNSKLYKREHEAAYSERFNCRPVSPIVWTCKSCNGQIPIVGNFQIQWTRTLLLIIVCQIEIFHSVILNDDNSLVHINIK